MRVMHRNEIVNYFLEVFIYDYKYRFPHWPDY